VAPPAGSANALVGVRPAAPCSSPSALHPRLSSFGSTPSALQQRGGGSSDSAAAAAKPANKAAPITATAVAAKPAHKTAPHSPASAAKPAYTAACTRASAAAKPAHTAAPLSAAVAMPADSGAYTKLLSKFPEVVNQSKALPPVKHDVLHHIETEGRPSSAKYRRLDPAKLEAAKAEFAELERQGVVRRSTSSWASPLHMVKKPDGTWRPCGDFRQLNLQTKPDRYPCPNIGDLTGRLAGCRVFSKLDLRKGYYQVPVKPEDVCKTAIVTPFGAFEFLRMPFGLRNAGQTFQRFMDSILADLPFCFVYLDDVLVASPTHEQHLVDLELVFARLQQQGLVINAEKCVFGVQELDYLGHHVTASGVTPMQSRVEAMRKYPQPKTVGQLQTFLGMANFYRRFLPAAAQRLRPLTDALKGGQQAQLNWSADMEQSFIWCKEKLCSAAELAHPEPAAEIFLAVDASATHVGAALQQAVAGQTPRPLAFFSAKLNAAQQKYSAFDRELLACYLAIRHFRWSLEGRSFYVLTDHKPLVFALHRLSDPWTARQQRHLSFIAEYTSDIRHVAGKENVVADALSRPAAAVAVPADEQVDFAKLAEQQSSCEDTLSVARSDKLEIKTVNVQGHEVLCDLSTGAIRPLVPEKLRKNVFRAIHDIAHPGTRATCRLITARYVWRGCSADITRWCRECVGCARGKIQQHVKTQVEPIPVPREKMQHIHVDIVGPLPVSQHGCSYLLTMIDRTTRWPEAVPLSSITAEKCVDTFVEAWVSRFGVPHTVTTDRGTQFTSTTWACMARRLGFKHVVTSAYHPQANGMVERLHRQIKESLRARQCGSAWQEHLPWVMLGLRAAPKEDSNVSSAEVLYGARLQLPGQVLEPSSAAITWDVPDPPSVIPLRQRSYAEVARGPLEDLQKTSYVYVRRGQVAGPLKPAYDGPYYVLSKEDKTFRLLMGDREESVSIDRLKPYSAENQPEVCVPPKRGRPPGTCGGQQSPQRGSATGGGPV
jgi:RNase H-like domain found in reverse transcriptase/Reverse transcriptase (RNA-dependent DNA polymerase)/Integrase core domain/Integrase zinc binding domain